MSVHLSIVLPLLIKHRIIIIPSGIIFTNLTRFGAKYQRSDKCKVCVTPNFKDKIECKTLCVPRDQSHISRQIIGSIIINVHYITIISQSLYINKAEIKDNS